MDKSGLFSFKGFENRHVLKLAPDAFAIMNNAFGEKIISPMEQNSTGYAAPGDASRGIQMQGGITSMNVNSAVSPAGSGRATIEIAAPQYTGTHNDYYVDMPSGVRMPYFVPMTEIKIYMKSRFITTKDTDKFKPQYYPVFWGFVTNVSESYTAGVSTFSLSCVDLLNWWAFQKVTVKPSNDNIVLGAPQANKFPTIFEYLNPWETIYALFMDTFFDQGNSNYNFVFPEYASIPNLPSLGLSSTDVARIMGLLSQDTNRYWSDRFGFQAFAGADPDSDDPTQSDNSNKAPLEMYGLVGEIDYSTYASDITAYTKTQGSTVGRTVNAELNLDFSILERLQPYGPFSLYGQGSTSVKNTKLEIANKVCDDTHMEFFLDLNGSFVFKPPMYNLDVYNGKDETYVIESEDTINFTFGQNTDGIVNFLEVTGPANYNHPDLNYKGLHIDYQSVRRYGMRHQILSMMYGNTPETLRAIAVAEMARINSKTKTGTLSMPLRSEMRLGYPVYLRHIDAYYYVTGISHSFTYGSAATTQLSLESRRDRIYDDGSITGTPGKILKAYVTEMKRGEEAILGGNNNEEENARLAEEAEKALEEIAASSETKGDLGQDNKGRTLNTLQKEYLKANNSILAGNNSYGLTTIRKAKTNLSSDAALPPGSRENNDTDANTSIQVSSNELIHITKNTVPYTDGNGYEHIGAFPYGANLRLDRKDGTKLVDMANRAESDVYINDLVNNLVPSNASTEE